MLPPDPATPVIKHGDVDTRIALKATDQAKVGDYKIKVVGHPVQGGDATVEFKLTVAPKDTFSLSLPLLSTTVKQGESQTFAVGINRDKTFDEDVSLLFGELPSGISMEPTAPVIKRGETEAKIVLTGTGDAALGNFDIKVTGHPQKGADASSDLKLTVAGK